MRLKIHRQLGPMLVAVALVALAAMAAAPQAALAVGKPNVVVIQADDQTVSQFTPEVMPKTFKHLVDRGTSFSDYIVTTSLCCPSRASFFTGQYAHNHGVFNNGEGGGYGALEDKRNVLPVWLQRAGYHTIHVGKFMNGYHKAVADPAEVAPGWDDWQTLFSGDGQYYGYALSDNGRVVQRGLANRDYVTRVLTNKAVSAVRTYAPERAPFYLQIDHRAPHVSRGNRRPGRCGVGARNAEPDPKDKTEFRGALPPTSRAFDELQMGDKPAFMRIAPPLTYRDRKSIRRHWSCALASLVGVDRSVGRVFHAIKNAGELRKTVFVYISDNGYFYGEHRIQNGKVLPYEEALHQPLVIRMPKRYRDGAHRVESSGKPVANIDLAPTILDLAHGRPCPPSGACRVMDGRSLMPGLTRSGTWPDRRAVLNEYRVAKPHASRTCDFAGIRTRNAIYVEHYSVANPGTNECEPTLEVERYDLKNDPHELRNECRAGLPARCPTGKLQNNLDRRLKLLRTCAGIKGRDPRVAGRPHCE